MCLQLIPGLSKTVKTTSQNRVPSNEVQFFYASAKTFKSIEDDENVDNVASNV